MANSNVMLKYHIKNRKLSIIIIFNEEPLFQKENKHYLKVHYPFLLEYFSRTYFDSKKILIFEYIESLPLNNFNDMKEQIKLILEVMIILEFLHYNNYIYRDLKPNNFLID